MTVDFTKFETDEHRFTFLDYRHFGEHCERNGGRAACGYFGYLKLREGLFEFSGFAGLKDPSAILAYAITHAVRAGNEITGLANTRLRIFLPNGSAQHQIKNYLPGWVSQGGCNQHGEKVREFSDWLDIREMVKSKQIVLELGKGRDFSGWFRDIDRCGEQIGQKACERKAYTRDGIWPDSQTHGLAKKQAWR